MTTAAIPENEPNRLKALLECCILDTAAEESFDDLVLLAAQICDTPISLMSLVDEGRQWFKANVGLRTTETSRDIAFCAHAILHPDMLVVSDATADSRFFDNPLVMADPKIRFYAGAPLITYDGFPLGTLCVIDRKPRKLSEFQARALRTLRRAVVTQLELRRSISKGKEAMQITQRVVDVLCDDCRRKAHVLIE